MSTQYLNPMSIQHKDGTRHPSTHSSSINDLESNPSSIPYNDIYETSSNESGCLLGHQHIVSHKRRKKKNCMKLLRALLIAGVVTALMCYVSSLSKTDSTFLLVNSNLTSSAKISAASTPIHGDAATKPDHPDSTSDNAEFKSYQCALITLGAYVASNIVCAAFSWWVWSCRFDSIFPAYVTAKWEMDPKYKKLSAEEKAKLHENLPSGCCMCCDSWSEDRSVWVAIDTRSNIVKMPKGAAKASICWSENICCSCVQTALWNFLTLNLCSLVPCCLAFPAHSRKLYYEYYNNDDDIVNNVDTNCAADCDCCGKMPSGACGGRTEFIPRCLLCEDRRLCNCGPSYKFDYEELEVLDASYDWYKLDGDSDHEMTSLPPRNEAKADADAAES